MPAVRTQQIPTPAPAPQDEAWEIPPIQCNEPEDGVLYAQMGPTGGKRGYPAITGNGTHESSAHFFNCLPIKYFIDSWNRKVQTIGMAKLQTPVSFFKKAVEVPTYTYFVEEKKSTLKGILIF